MHIKLKDRQDAEYMFSVYPSGVKFGNISAVYVLLKRDTVIHVAQTENISREHFKNATFVGIHGCMNVATRKRIVASLIDAGYTNDA
jgi:hypothetical protein